MRGGGGGRGCGGFVTSVVFISTIIVIVINERRPVASATFVATQFAPSVLQFQKRTPQKNASRLINSVLLREVERAMLINTPMRVLGAID